MATDHLTSALHSTWDGEDDDEVMAEIHADRRAWSEKHGGDFDSMAEEIRGWEKRHILALWTRKPLFLSSDRDTIILLGAAGALGLAGLFLLRQR